MANTIQIKRETAAMCLGVLGSLAADWRRNAAYYAGAEQTKKAVELKQLADRNAMQLEAACEDLRSAMKVGDA